MMPRTLSRLFLPAVLATATACSDSTSPARGVTDEMLTGDVAENLALATTQDLAAMNGMESLVAIPGLSSPMSPISALGNCTWNAGGQGFDCPGVTTPDGLTLTRWVQFYSGGTFKDSYDSLTTDSLVFGAWLKGTRVEADRTVWLKHGLTAMVTGLTGSETERTWRGESARDDSAHVTGDNVERTTHILSNAEIDHVVYKLPRNSFPFPQSGTITHDVTVSSIIADGTEARNRQGTRHAVITFNGTRTASVTIDTKACALDLVTGKISCQ